MSRLKALAAQPRLALGALLTLLLAAGAVVGSGADFTASSANPSNTFASGTLTMTNSNAGAILSASGMRPGDAPTLGTVDIKNTGSLSGAFTLSRGTISDSDGANPMSAKLDAIVTDCGTFTGATPPVCGDGDDSVKYTGTIAAMGTNIALGTYAAGVQHRYRFSVALNSSAGNAYQGDSSTVQFDFAAA
jgi:spore coat-associated protein N